MFEFTNLHVHPDLPTYVSALIGHLDFQEESDSCSRIRQIDALTGTGMVTEFSRF